MKRHRQKILIILCFLLSFDPKARLITACKEYLFNRPKLTELRLTDASNEFKDNYIRGLDKARKHLRLAQKLRTGSIDPWKTHIEEFAALVKPHLDYIERGIRSQDSADKLERLAILEDFRIETQSWLEKREVSYRRWVNLNLRLSILATPKNDRNKLHFSNDWLTDERLESLYQQRKEANQATIDVKILDKFPEVIIAPQMDGLTGIMALTRMTTRRVYLHALENKASHVDGKLSHPDWIFWHDSLHMNNHESYFMNWIDWHRATYEEMLLPFHNAFFLHIQTLPMRKREMLELVYHYMVYEQAHYAYGTFDPQKVLEYPTTSFLREFQSDHWSADLFHNRTILPDWVKPNNSDDIKAFLTEAMNLYDDTAQEVFNSL